MAVQMDQQEWKKWEAMIEREEDPEKDQQALWEVLERVLQTLEATLVNAPGWVVFLLRIMLPLSRLVAQVKAALEATRRLKMKNA